MLKPVLQCVSTCKTHRLNIKRLLFPKQLALRYDRATMASVFAVLIWIHCEWSLEILMSSSKSYRYPCEKLMLFAFPVITLSLFVGAIVGLKYILPLVQPQVVELVKSFVH